MENKKISCEDIQNLKDDFSFYYDSSLYGLVNKRKEIFNTNYNGMIDTYAELDNIKNNYLPFEEIKTSGLEDKINWINSKKEEVFKL